MWHASVAYRGRKIAHPVTFEQRARRVLSGVGDASLGEWVEHSAVACHIRRRLSADEAVGFVLRDIRGTPEALERFERIPAHVRRMIPDALLDEVTTCPHHP